MLQWSDEGEVPNQIPTFRSLNIVKPRVLFFMFPIFQGTPNNSIGARAHTNLDSCSWMDVA